MQRTQKNIILEDLKKKLVFIVGPRQVGKTWLSKEIMKEYKNPRYLSYENEQSKVIIKNEGWSKETDLLIFDEIHKMRGWKNYLKGVYDTKRDGVHILVTGSARLDAYKNAGDSMAGRYRLHHLLPLSIKELENIGMLNLSSVKDLIQKGGFPEPFLEESEKDRNIWRKFYAESLLREDVLDFRDIDNFKAIGQVFELLRGRVGSPVSYASIAGVIGISPVTVKTYISILESLYIVFLVKPYTKKVERSILKEPKVYFYDTGLVKGDDGIKLENMVAVSLLKHALALGDEQGKNVNIRTLRNKDKKEVDFVLVDGDDVVHMVEVKLSDDSVSSGLLYFVEKNGFKGYQIVKDLKHPYVNGSIDIIDVEEYLKKLYI